MSESSTSSKGQRSKRARWQRRRIVLGAIIVLSAAFVWFAIDLWRVYTDEPELTYKFRQQLMELSAQSQGGIDASRWPELSAIVLRIQQSVGSAGVAAYDDLGVEVEEEQLQEAADEIMANSPILAELRAVLDQGPIVRPFGSAGTLGNERLPIVSQIRELSDTLSRMTVRAVEAEQWDQSIDLLKLTLRLNDTMIYQPEMLYYLIGLAAHTEVVRSVSEALAASAVPQIQRRKLFAILNSAGGRDQVMTHIIEMRRQIAFAELHWAHGSRGYALPLANVMEGARYASDPSITSTGFYDLSGSDRTFPAAILARWRLATRDECEDLATQLYDKLKKPALTSFGARHATWPPSELQAELDRNKYGELRLLMHLDTTTFNVLDQSIQWQRAAMLRAAIEQYRRDHGALPASLDALTPGVLDSVPLDPISGIAFGYKLIEDDPDGLGYLLCSAGPDGVDDGGLFDMMWVTPQSLIGTKSLDMPIE